MSYQGSWFVVDGQVKEDLVRLLLPYLMAALGPDITADYRAASLMILTQLASQATLSDTLVTGQQHTSCRLIQYQVVSKTICLFKMICLHGLCRVPECAELLSWLLQC